MTDTPSMRALERLEKTFEALMTNPEKPQIFGLPFLDFEKIRRALESHDALVEALEGMCSIYDTDGDHGFTDGENARQKAREALARAKGE